jgi:GxxExxY protein
MTKQEYMEMYQVVGAAMEVHSVLGRGMAEPIYQEALAVEMRKRGMIAEREKELRLHYKDVVLEKTYFADFYYNGILIELKSLEEILPVHRSQLFNYMRITGLYRGILFNFGEESLYTERFLYLSEYDDFVMLNHDNYKDYISDELLT